MGSVLSAAVEQEDSASASSGVTSKQFVPAFSSPRSFGASTTRLFVAQQLPPPAVVPVIVPRALQLFRRPRDAYETPDPKRRHKDIAPSETPETKMAEKRKEPMRKKRKVASRKAPSPEEDIPKQNNIYWKGRSHESTSTDEIASTQSTRVLLPLLLPLLMLLLLLLLRHSWLLLPACGGHDKHWPTASCVH